MEWEESRVCVLDRLEVQVVALCMGEGVDEAQKDELQISQPLGVMCLEKLWLWAAGWALSPLRFFCLPEKDSPTLCSCFRSTEECNTSALR